MSALWWRLVQWLSLGGLGITNFLKDVTRLVCRQQRIGIAKMLRIFLKKLVGKSRQNMADEGRHVRVASESFLSFSQLSRKKSISQFIHLSSSSSGLAAAPAGTGRRSAAPDRPCPSSTCQSSHLSCAVCVPGVKAAAMAIWADLRWHHHP